MAPSRHLLAAGMAAAVVAVLGSAASAASAGAQSSPEDSSTASATSATNTQSGTAYTYWSFWTADASGTWTYAENGAGAVTPPDGSSTGWRYGIGATPQLTEQPRIRADFGRVCGQTPVVSGFRRTAVVVDYGTTEEAPSGETPPNIATKCASSPDDANGLQVLAGITSVRQSQPGLVCGVSGYPASGCGEQVSLAALLDSPDSTQSQLGPSTLTTASNSWVPAVLGLGLIAVLVWITILIGRHRRAEDVQEVII